MMKNIYKKAVLALGTVALLHTSCSDWIDPESLSMDYATIETQNPELYENYLKDLREYRNSEHQLVYVWFDNSEKVPYSRAHHLTDLPDSIDVVGLIYPDRLTNMELEEIKTIREKKGMKVIYTIDYDKMKSAYNDKILEASDKEPFSKEFRPFLTDSLAYALSLAGKYNYDGICINYSGKSSLHMPEEELREYMQNENCFMDIISDWMERNGDKYSLVFQGSPQNVLAENAVVLDKSSIIFISGLQASSTSELTSLLTLGYIEKYKDRYGVSVVGVPLNTADKHYMFGDVLAVNAAAEWASVPQNGMNLCAVGAYDVSGDYFSADSNYKNIRNMISILNPSIK
ncbi:glycoside hydrolase family 18 [Phocaeicola sp.]|uniref:glycoside hydrolase family 18 n=1 Tax=Phocaeicola sp. TaxID=2773926 RepID=UPI003A920C0D